MIKSFNCKLTHKLYLNIHVSKFSAIENAARRKLEILDAVSHVESLRIPPSNRLEKLKGNRIGQYSIRINDQYRVCFYFKDGNAFDVEIVDYH